MMLFLLLLLRLLKLDCFDLRHLLLHLHLSLLLE
jgi:hypothetical protein